LDDDSEGESLLVRGGVTNRGTIVTGTRPYTLHIAASDRWTMGATRLNPPIRRAERAFVGRTRELGELHTALDEAIAGRGRLVLVAGEPGIGKTRLAEEACAQATGETAETCRRSGTGDQRPDGGFG
jgi:hypothetical protein